jgi:hypothetical protein
MMIMEANFAADETLRVLIRSAISAGEVITNDFKSFLRPSGTKKTDGTQVTDTDKMSQAVAKALLATVEMPILAEEDEKVRPTLLCPLIILDPLDGTSWWISGNASQVTVMIGTLNAKGEIDRAVVYQPITGRLQFARLGYGAYATNVSNYLEADIVRSVFCRVTKVDKKPIVAWDRTWNFTKSGYQDIPKSALDKLYCDLGNNYKVLGGPNGINHALVAWGGDGVLAGITTALGGGWDATGVLLVIEAGGCATAFKDGVEVNPLLVLDYNILITAANPEVFAKVRGMVEMTILPCAWNK